MEYVRLYESFLLVTSYLVKKVTMEMECYISLGWAIILLALFAQNIFKLHSAVEPEGF